MGNSTRSRSAICSGVLLLLLAGDPAQAATGAIFASGNAITSAAHYFLAYGDTDQTNRAFPMNDTGNFKVLTATCETAITSTTHVALYTGTPGSMTKSALDCTLSTNTTPATCTITTDVAWTDGSLWAIGIDTVSPSNTWCRIFVGTDQLVSVWGGGAAGNTGNRYCSPFSTGGGCNITTNDVNSQLIMPGDHTFGKVRVRIAGTASADQVYTIRNETAAVDIGTVTISSGQSLSSAFTCSSNCSVNSGQAVTFHLESGTVQTASTMFSIAWTAGGTILSGHGANGTNARYTWAMSVTSIQYEAMFPIGAPLQIQQLYVADSINISSTITACSGSTTTPACTSALTCSISTGTACSDTTHSVVLDAATYSGIKISDTGQSSGFFSVFAELVDVPPATATPTITLTPVVTATPTTTATPTPTSTTTRTTTPTALMTATASSTAIRCADDSECPPNMGCRTPTP